MILFYDIYIKFHNWSRALMNTAKWVQYGRACFMSSIALKKEIVEGPYLTTLVDMAADIVNVLRAGGKLLLCGNGGSAADAQHLAAELLIRLRSDVNRESLPAIALTMDSSTMTACGNDYGFECLYERMVQALGQPKDVLLGITTSGRSANVNRALKMAQSKGIMTLGFLGGSGGEALQYCDHAFVVPSKETARIQEAHITAGHVLMELIEEMMLEKKDLQRVDACIV